jgi:hypothetical protein
LKPIAALATCFDNSHVCTLESASRKPYVVVLKAQMGIITDAAAQQNS